MAIGDIIGLGYGIVAATAPFIILAAVLFIAYEVYKGASIRVNVSFDAGTALAAVLVAGAIFTLAFAVFTLAYAVNPQAFNQTTLLTLNPTP